MALKINTIKEYTVHCEECNNTEWINNGDGEYKFNDTPSKYFKRQGWREIERKTLCPDCVLKQNRLRKED